MPNRSTLPQSWALGAIWLAFILRAAFYCHLIPHWEGYDEWAHYAFVQHVRVHHSLPSTKNSVSEEIRASLRLAPLTRQFADWSPPHKTHETYWRLPPEDRAARRSALMQLSPELASRESSDFLMLYEAQQPPLYYWLLALPDRLWSQVPIAERVLRLRIVTVFIASFVIPCAFFAAIEVFGSPAIALAICAWITAMPELMIDVARVGNDPLAIALASAIMLLVLRNRGRGVLLGIALGLALLTKAYLLAFLPVIVLSALWRKRFSGLALTLAIAISIGGWWYWRSHHLNGSWTGEQFDAAASAVTFTTKIAAVARVKWLSVLDLAFWTHIWMGAWSFLGVRSWIYHVFEFLALVTGATALWAARRGNRRLLILLTAEASFAAGIAYHAVLIFLTMGISMANGWYFYPTIVSEVLFFAVGMLVLVGRSRLRYAIAAATFLFAALDLYTTHFVFAPYYSGLIAHRANGTLAAFHWSDLNGTGVSEILARLNLSPVWWILYLAATFYTFLSFVTRPTSTHSTTKILPE